MVSAQLAGGLGNQLFQIATAYALATDNNDYAAFEFSKHYSLGQGQSPYCYKSSIFSNIVDLKRTKKDYTFYEGKVEELFYVPNIHLVGFFHDKNYFARHTHKLLNLLKIKPITNVNTCSVHVRRGDHKPYLGLSYYKQAMALFKNSNFLIFTDDLLWCKENFVGNNIYVIKNGSADQDMLLMSQCQNNIISNSTYSWWASWLNTAADKAIIAPGILSPKLHLKEMIII